MAFSAVDGGGRYYYDPKTGKYYWNKGMNDWFEGDSGNDYMSGIGKVQYDRSLLSLLNQNGTLSNINNPFWNSLSDTQKQAYLNEYFSDAGNTLGINSGVLDLDAFLSDVDALNNLSYNAPQAPNFEDIWQTAQTDANSEVDKLLASLSSDEARRTAEYQDSLNDLRQQYGDARSTLLSKDYQDRARTFDTLSSDLSKTRRNALEAGASAGLRIAGNINTMLSAQNKQAQQSMETSNNLAQMLLNQRNAQNALRSDYSNYMSNTTRERNSLEASRYDRSANRYNTAANIAQRNYDNAYSRWNDTAQAMVNANGTNSLAAGGIEYARKKSSIPGNNNSQ